MLFERLKDPVEHKKIKLDLSPFWIKAGPYPSECDRKDLMHPIESTFKGLLSSEDKGYFVRIKVQLDVQRKLRRGIFIVPDDGEKT